MLIPLEARKTVVKARDPIHTWICLTGERSSLYDGSKASIFNRITRPFIGLYRRMAAILARNYEAMRNAVKPDRVIAKTATQDYVRSDILAAEQVEVMSVSTVGDLKLARKRNSLHGLKVHTTQTPNPSHVSYPSPYAAHIERLRYPKGDAEPPQ